MNVLTRAALEQCLEEHFELHFGQEAVTARLVRVARLTGPGQGGEPFSLLFRADMKQALPQGIVRISHPRLGDHDVFLVPVGQGQDSIDYEAVFN
ncbi:MAG: hypothetical protein JJU06_03410 [Ectothiorhodospiraceae bacterium]|nr:hypothetical protein [Ectothiorhodospiraceae bacterium]MCH8505565.1 hypothetical protein [Ectothiorhodospiraceae bacterium]